MEWKYDEGDELFFNCTDSNWSGIHNVKCKVVSRLTEDEADLCETGPMYRLALTDLVIIPAGPYESSIVHHADAFEDELTPEPLY